MNKRILVPLVLLALAAPTLAACGGGGSSAEGKITETIETVATTSAPSNCTKLETLSWVEQNTTEKGKAAIGTCETEAENGSNEVAKGVTVSNVSVNGEKATAEAAFEGGSLGSQTLELAMVEEGTWKLDQVEGFAKYDGKALGAAFEKQFEEEEPQELKPEQAKCIAGKIAGLSKAEAEEVFFGGSAETIIELAQSCA